jgi:hypothetical protein
LLFNFSHPPVGGRLASPSRMALRAGGQPSARSGSSPVADGDRALRESNIAEVHKPRGIGISRNDAEAVVFSSLWQKGTCFQGDPLFREQSGAGPRGSGVSPVTTRPHGRDASETPARRPFPLGGFAAPGYSPTTPANARVQGLPTKSIDPLAPASLSGRRPVPSSAPAPRAPPETPSPPPPCIPRSGKCSRRAPRLPLRSAKHRPCAPTSPPHRWQ